MVPDVRDLEDGEELELFREVWEEAITGLGDAEGLCVWLEALGLAGCHCDLEGTGVGWDGFSSLGRLGGVGP